MPYYKDFCMYCSIRLGAMAVGVISIIEVAIYGTLLALEGPEWFGRIAKMMEIYIKKNGLDESHYETYRLMNDNKETYHIVITSIHGSYMVACVLNIIGAYILNQWLLLPYIIMELIRLGVTCWLFCILLITIKRSVNLGILISYAVIGSFIVLILLYLWGCVVSLFHAIFIVKSAKYRAVYGDDPLISPPESDLPGSSTSRTKVERVKFYPSPNFNAEADNLKPTPPILVTPADQHPFGMRKPRRTKTDYIELRRNHLSDTSVGHS